MFQKRKGRCAPEVRRVSEGAEGQGWDCNTWQSELADSFVWILSNMSPLLPIQSQPRAQASGPLPPGVPAFPRPHNGLNHQKGPSPLCVQVPPEQIKEIFQAFLTSPSQVKPFPPTCKDFHTMLLLSISAPNYGCRKDCCCCC